LRFSTAQRARPIRAASAGAEHGGAGKEAAAGGGEPVALAGALAGGMRFGWLGLPALWYANAGAFILGSGSTYDFYL
jgi:hypothetical protein